MSIFEATGGEVVLMLDGGGTLLALAVLVSPRLLPLLPWLFAAVLSFFTRRGSAVHKHCLRMLPVFEPGLKVVKRRKVK